MNQVRSAGTDAAVSTIQSQQAVETDAEVENAQSTNSVVASESEAVVLQREPTNQLDTIQSHAVDLSVVPVDTHIQDLSANATNPRAYHDYPNTITCSTN